MMYHIHGAWALEKVTLQLRWDHQFQFAGYYAAKWNGYYEAVGIDVEIQSAVTPDGILSAVDEVGSKRAQFGIGGADILMGIDQGLPLVVVASIFQHSAAAFFTRQDTVIHHPSDFLDLKVARRLNDLVDIEFQATLKAEGIDPEKITPFPHQPGIEHLLSGAVDVIPGYSINIPYAACLHGVVLNEFLPTRYGAYFYGDSIFTHERIIEETPTQVSRFKDASIKGWSYALVHPEEMVQKISSTFSNREISVNFSDYNRFQSQGVAELIHFPDIEVGHINPIRWEKMHHQLMNVGILTHPLNSDRLIFDPERWQRLAAEKRYRLINKMFIVIICALVIGLSWIYFLKKMVKNKTNALQQSHEQLKVNEERFRNIFENANIGICMLSTDGTLIAVNPVFCRTLGYAKEELVGKPVFDITHPEDSAMTRKYIEESVDQKKKPNHFEKRYRHKDGTIVWGEISSSLILDPSGSPDYFITHMKDVTLKKRAEQEREEFRMVMEHIAETIVVTDTKGVVRYVNPIFEQTTGYPKSEVIGRPIGRLKSASHDKAFYRQMWQTISSGNTWNGQLINQRKDGRHYTEQASISPILDDRGNIIRYVAVKHDITGLLAMEDQLRQAHKMEAIGTLAGGIAHDFNNILTSIMGFTDLALGNVEKGSEMESDLTEIYTAGKRAKELVKQILTFARKSDEALQPIQVSLIVKEVIKFLRASIPSSIIIDQHIESQALIMGNATQVHQIVLNLCTNAAHTMDELGGTLTIALTDIEIDTDNPVKMKKIVSTTIESLKPLSSGSYICLTVSDTGEGIPNEILSTIFDPYFTTKPKEEGTGMGLAVVHGIVKKYGGTISVISEPNQGSCFAVYLPMVKMKTTPPPLEPDRIPGGNERILLVDDEPGIIVVWQRLFKSLGYDVAAYQRSLEALAAFQADPDGFDLVISDVTMPEMTGDRLTQEMRSIRPEIPIFLCTGFSRKISAETVLDTGARALLFKPLIKSEIALKLREVLDAPKA